MATSWFDLSIRSDLASIAQLKQAFVRIDRSCLAHYGGIEFTSTCDSYTHRATSVNRSRMYLLAENHDLILIVYAQGSDFDKRISQRSDPGSHGLNVLSAYSDKLWLLPGDAGTSDTQDPARVRTVTIPFAPKCGQSCSGPNNLCTSNDGFKCIADP